MLTKFHEAIYDSVHKKFFGSSDNMSDDLEQIISESPSRVPTGPGNLEKSWNFKIRFKGLEKSWYSVTLYKGP